MFPSKYVCLLAILLFPIIGVQADCQFWSGTAPFCEGSCPSGCKTLATSNCGNGACCFTGHKALCQCCPDRLCHPTQTTATCYGFILVCKNQQVTLTSHGPVIRTCSAYVCGLCFGFGSLFPRQNDDCNDDLDITHIDPMLRDVLVQGNVTLSEDEIERGLVKEFGPKLTPKQMRDVKIVKVIQPDPSIKGDGNKGDGNTC